MLILLLLILFPWTALTNYEKRILFQISPKCFLKKIRNLIDNNIWKLVDINNVFKCQSILKNEKVYKPNKNKTVDSFGSKQNI